MDECCFSGGAGTDEGYRDGGQHGLATEAGLLLCNIQTGSGIGFDIQILQSSMQLLQRGEKMLFRWVLQMQSGSMQSKFLFTLVFLLRLIFKERFLILFFLIPNSFTKTMKFLLTFYVPQYELTIILVLLGLLGALVLSNVGEGWPDRKVREGFMLLVPCLDALLFPVAMALMIIIQKTTNTVFPIVAVVIIIFVSLLVVTYNIFNFSKSPKSINLFLTREGRQSAASHVLVICLGYYIIATWLKAGSFSVTEQVILAMLHLAFSAIKFKQMALLRYYINPYAQTVASLMYLMELNLGILAVAETISQLSLVADNLLYMLVVMTTLAFLSLTKYLDHRQIELYISQAAEIKGEYQAILYLDCLAELARKVENEQEDIILISLRTLHEMGCFCPLCFCNFASKDLNIFIRTYVQSELHKLSQQFNNQPSILLSILYFKIQLFNFYPDILCKLQEYQLKFTLNTLERFYLFGLVSHVQKYINTRNREISAVESEHMFRLEGLREEMEGVIRGEVELREKKWRYLSRGLCRIEELQSQCDAQLKYIERMMRIYQDNKAKFKKSKEFNLLLLFYFVKVSFLNVGGDLRTNLKEIYYGFKVDELKSFKEFKKFIYHKSSCALESLVDSKSMGTITNVSRNVEDLFGFPPEKVLGTSINSLMPDFLVEEHDRILTSWAKTGTWRTIGKLKEIYCVHKEKHCFSALLYLKLYVRDGALYFITSLFKLNDADYLMLSPEGRVEGIGRKFMRVLGEGAKKLPLHLMIENVGDTPEYEKYEERKTYKRVFMSLTGAEERLTEFHSEEGSSILELDGLAQHYARFYLWLRENSEQKYFVEFTVQQYKMGEVVFPILRILQSHPIERNKTSLFLSRTRIGFNSMKEHLGSQLEVEIESQCRSEAEKEEDDDEGGQFENLAGSSMASMSEKENYPLSKMVERFVQLLLNPSKLSDRRLIRYTLIFVLLVALLGLLNFLSWLLYHQLLLQIEGIFFAGGAVSDIMQTTEIAYDHVYQLRSKLLSNQFTDFDSQLRSARYVQQYVYGLKQFSFAHLLTDTTEFSKKRLYEYIQKPAKWKQGDKTTEVGTFQFLQHMYYLTNQMVNQLEKLKQNNLTSLDPNDLERMRLNFPEIQHLNQFYLEDYTQSGIESSETLKYVSIGSMVLFGLISLAIGLLANGYYRFRFEQTSAGFNFLAMIPSQLVERMKDYYNEISWRILEPNLLKRVGQNQEQIFQIDNHDIGKVDSARGSSFSKVKLINYGNYYRWIFIVALFSVLNAMNYLNNNQIRTTVGPSKTLIRLINSLMRGENRLLESYFELKANYYLDNPQGMNLQFFTQVQKHIDDSGKDWNYYASELSILLVEYSPALQGKFMSALADNICVLAASDLPQYEAVKCVAQLQLNMLDGGIMIAMDFFRRTVREAIQSLKSQYVTNTQPVFTDDYFRQLDFTELDKMQIYMFKIYQLTQAICFDAFYGKIKAIVETFMVFSVVFVAVYVLMVVGQLYTISREKQRLARLYARLALVPFGILKSNPRIINTFKEGIEYTDS